MRTKSTAASLGFRFAVVLALGLCADAVYGASPKNDQDHKMGTTSVGAKWVGYGVYLQRLIETIQTQWHRNIRFESGTLPSGTVIVRIKIDSEGMASALADPTSTSSKRAADLCISAITARSPYGKWSDDMIAVLGDSQEMTFTFHYK